MSSENDDQMLENEDLVRAKVATEFRELAATQKARGEAGVNLGQLWDGTRQSMELNALADWIERPRL